MCWEEGECIPNFLFVKTVFEPGEIMLWKEFCDAGCDDVVDTRAESLGAVHRAFILEGQAKCVGVFGDKSELLVCSM